MKDFGGAKSQLVRVKFLCNMKNLKSKYQFSQKDCLLSDCCSPDEPVLQAVAKPGFS